MKKMKVTNQEVEVLTILRLLKKISKKHHEGYYSMDMSPSKIGKNYYLPCHGHNTFTTHKEAKEALINLLKLDHFAYKYNIDTALDKRNKLKDSISELNEKKNRIL